MPPHLGHIALVEYGLKYVDELVLCVCSAKSEPIKGATRYSWMKKALAGYPNIHVSHISADLPHNKVPTKEGSRVWAEYINKHFGRFNYIFTSEEYGGFMAEYMGAESKIFDFERKQFPISATMIREDPKKYWDYIHPVARHYFEKMLKVK